MNWLNIIYFILFYERKKWKLCAYSVFYIKIINKGMNEKAFVFFLKMSETPLIFFHTKKNTSSYKSINPFFPITENKVLWFFYTVRGVWYKQ